MTWSDQLAPDKARWGTDVTFFSLKASGPVLMAGQQESFWNDI